MEQRYTDEQIREEVVNIMENPLLRRCCQCANRNQSCTKCEQLGIPISKFMYAGHCKYFITDEERLIADAKKAMAERETEVKKDDRLLTMSFVSVEMSLVYLEHFLSRVEADYNKAVKRIEAKYKDLKQRMTEDDERYLKERKKEYKKLADYVNSLHSALKKMDFHIKEARKQFTHMIEPKLNKAFFNEDFTVFKDKDYDDHGEDVFVMSEACLKIFDTTYMSAENGEAIIDFIDSLPAERLMEKEDYKRYKFRR